MRERNYRGLWEQFRVLVMCSPTKTWTKQELYEAIQSMELMQLIPDPLGDMLKMVKEVAL